MLREIEFCGNRDEKIQGTSNYQETIRGIYNFIAV